VSEPWESAWEKWRSNVEHYLHQSLYEECFQAGYEARAAEGVADFTDLEAEVMLRCLDNCGSAWSSPDDSDIGRLRSKLRALRAKLER
jgi:hypothetical protein